MNERIIVLLVAFGSVLLYDYYSLFHGLDKKEKTAYLCVMVIALYLGIEYAAKLDLFGLYSIIDLTLTDIARAIDKLLTPPKA
ncbi:hypothetical protein AB6A23_14940 [Paenibacillus tarimensis]